VSFGTGWALIGLVALVPLVALHLRDRSRQDREVSSLVLWRELEVPRPTGNRGRRSPRQPLLLLLEALALVLFVLALAQPRASATVAPGVRIAVLDDSLLMSVPGRLAAAKAALARTVSTTPAGERVDIVLAQGSPRVLYRGSRDGVAAALRAVKPTLAPSSLPAALTVAAGLAAGPGDTITVIVARGERLPRTVGADRGQLRTVTIGSQTDDQGIFGAAARCGIGTPATCEIDAIVENFGLRTSVDRLTAKAAGRPPLRFSVKVPAGGTASIVLGAVASEQVTIRIDGADAVSGADTAWVSVPAASGLPPRTVATLVGEPSQALPLARAFAAVPGLQLRLLTPSRYRPAYARSSDLVILDDWLPKGALPPAPSVLLVDPPRIPGGKVTGSLADAVLSGTDATSPLLSGVNLSSLVINSGGARKLTLPSWVTPVAWSADGPLLAAGDDGRTRLAILGFEPDRTDLAQLAAFPLLAGNIVAWASAWAPAIASAGEPLSVDATPGARSVTLARGQTVLARLPLNGRPVALGAPSPGRYTVRETGPGVSRRAIVTVNDVLPAPAGGGPVDMSAARAAALTPPPQWSRWFLLAALVLLACEWLYWLSTRPRPVH
jgi:hypothetical protein